MKRQTQMSARWLSAGRLSAAALAVLALAACGDKAEAPKTDKAGAAAGAASAPAADPMVVNATAELQQRLKTATVQKTAVAETLAVVGRLDFNEQGMSRVGSAVTGRVSELMGEPGQRVAAGSVLATLHSTELGAAQLAYLKSRAQRELAAQAAERAKLLLASDVIGSAEAQRRQSELQVAEVEMRAAADQLRVMGVAPKALAATAETGAITSTSVVTSTVDGVVVERKVNRGQVVQPADVMFTVADITRLWAVAQVPEALADRVSVGQKVKIDIPSSGIAPMEAELSWVSDTVNPETRTVTVRAELPNRARKLRPAMLANVQIEPRAVDRLVVPAAAVVRENDSDHVFVRTAERRYKLQSVKLGPDVGGQRPVISGLQGGETVVVDGAFHLNNERNRAALGS